MQPLQDRFGGWNSSDIVPAFAYYARVVFTAFGGRIKQWTTLNEPQTFCFFGYGLGTGAPGVQNQVAALPSPRRKTLLIGWAQDTVISPAVKARDVHIVLVTV
jgi:beta-glucosidase/6-phospho-beta-glucosidase/beta-galactosidase